MQQDDKPAIIVLDPDGADAAVTRELMRRYSNDYVVVSAVDSAEMLDSLQALADGSADVALVLADRGSNGVEVLAATRALYPSARRALLLRWNEHRTHREEIAEAFAQRDVEGLVTRPSDRPDERFHRSVTELLEEWWRLRGSATASVRIVGDSRSARVAEICDVLQRHDMPFTYHTSTSQAGATILHIAGVDTDAGPVIALLDGRTLVNPSNIELANALGARTRPGTGVYDVVVVGGGPAGLAAAVYAESEGLRTALIEPTAMGGQAGTSSMIRNYLGFPRGISGAELAARAFEQAILFGTEMIYAHAATGLRADEDLRVVQLEDGTEVPGRSVVIATGVSYRTLDIPSFAEFNGVGVSYGSAIAEAASLTGQPVFVIGGGNSAGQAALHLAKFASQVTILVRAESLARSMSEYLITEIDATANIDVRYRTDVVDASGDGRLETIELRHRERETTETVRAAALFVLIGAEPFTDWLPAEVSRDEWGYILTGPTHGESTRLAYESTMPGVFAVGDVRRDSVKRVASATGEGAVCVRVLHEYLERQRPS
ncbi:MAG TPA: FAD-dependent oxidoreductase [Acidimicrobiales bacterium]|jgi:thioredoxin reductase (NADPH)|nr:FAD-dependent oxidoreductase [Acidimicrobiales bacterium]